MGRPLSALFDKKQKKLSNNRSYYRNAGNSSENNLFFQKIVVAFPVESLYTVGGAKWSKRALKWRGVRQHDRQISRQAG